MLWTKAYWVCKHRINVDMFKIIYDNNQCNENIEIKNAQTCFRHEYNVDCM